MGYYKNPSDMFGQRSEKAKKTADAEYAQYKQAEKDGDKEASQKHYLKSQKYYESYKDGEEKAKKYDGKTFKDLNYLSGPVLHFFDGFEG